MRKTGYIFLILLLIFVCIFSFAACGSEDVPTLTIQNAKGSFVLGEEFSVGDLIVTKITENGEEATELLSGEYTIDFSQFDNTKEGTYDITVTLTGTEITYVYQVIVKKLNAILAVSYTGGTIYTTDDIASISLTLAEGNTAGTVVLDAGQTLTEGTKDYTWTFTPSVIGYITVTGNISLTVIAPPTDVAELDIIAPPQKLTYTAFENFDAEGLEINAIYTDGTSRLITGYTVIDGQSLSTVTTSIVIEYYGKTVTIGIIVNKADAVYKGSTINPIAAVYGQVLSDFTLPEGFVWENSEEAVGVAGVTTKIAIYTPVIRSYDYNPQSMELTVNVTKANPVYTVPEAEAEYGVALNTIALTEGFTWADPLALLEYDIGTELVIAIFTPEDTDNYNTITNIEVQVTVIKSNLTYTVLPSGLILEYNETLNSLSNSLPIGFVWANSSIAVQELGNIQYDAHFTYNADSEHYNTFNVSITVNVTKAEPYGLFTMPVQISASYGTVLSSIAFADANLSWVNPNESVGNVQMDNSTVEHSAVYTPVDALHYNTATITVDILITPLDSDITVKTYVSGTIYDYMSLYATNMSNVLKLVIDTNGNAENEGTLAYKPGQVLTLGTNDYNWEYTPDSINYTACEGTTSLTVVANVVESLGISYNPSKSVYNAFETFVTTGMIIRAYYTNSTNAIITDYTITYQSVNNYIQGTDTYVVVNYQSKAVNCNITANKLDVVENTDYVIPADLSAIYGDTLADVIFADSKFSWVETDASVGNAGNNYFDAIFTPIDTTNYNTAAISVSVTVDKAIPLYTAPVGLTAQYGDTVGSISITNPVNGQFAWQDESINTVLITLGDNLCYVEFVPVDSDNYYSVSDIATMVNVIKCDTSATVSYTGGDVYDCDLLSEVVLTIDSSSVSGTAALMQGQNWVTGTSNYTWTFTPADSANYNSCEGLVALKINKYAPEELTLSGTSATNNYVARSTFDVTGITVTAIYNNGNEVILANEDYSIIYQGADNMLHGGDNYVTFSYVDNGITVTSQYNLDNTVVKISYIVEVSYNDRIEIDNTVINYIHSSNITLAVDSQNVEGAANFDENQVIELNSKVYNWTFTPVNTTDYQTVNGSINLTAYIDVDTTQLTVYTYDIDTYAQLDATRDGSNYTFAALKEVQLSSIYASDSLGNVYNCTISEGVYNLGTVLTLDVNLEYSGLVMASISITATISESYLTYLTIALMTSSTTEFTVNCLNIYDRIYYQGGTAYKIYNGSTEIDDAYALSTIQTNTLTLSVKKEINGEILWLSENFTVIYEALPAYEVTVGGTSYELYYSGISINAFASNPTVTFSFDAAYSLKYLDRFSSIVDYTNGSSFETGETYLFFVYNSAQENVQEISISIHSVTYINSIKVNYLDMTQNESYLTTAVLGNNDGVILYSLELLEDMLFQSFDISVADTYTYQLILNGEAFDGQNLFIGTNIITMYIYDSLGVLAETATIYLSYTKQILYDISNNTYLTYSYEPFNQYVLHCVAGTQYVTILYTSGYLLQVWTGIEYQNQVTYSVLTGNNIYNCRLIYTYNDVTYYNKIVLNLIVDDYVFNDYVTSITADDDSISLVYENINGCYYITAPITLNEEAIAGHIVLTMAEGYKANILFESQNIILRIMNSADDSLVYDFVLMIVFEGVADDDILLTATNVYSDMEYTSLSTDEANPTVIDGLNLLSVIAFNTSNPYAQITITSSYIVCVYGNKYMFNSSGTILATITVIATDNVATATYYLSFVVEVTSPSLTLSIGGDDITLLAEFTTTTILGGSDILATTGWEMLYAVMPTTVLGGAIEDDNITIDYSLLYYSLRMNINGILYTGTGSVIAVVCSLNGQLYISLSVVINVDMEVQLNIIFSDTAMTQAEVETLFIG